MNPTPEYISNFIKSQFPEYYRETNSVIVDFILAYYEWMEQQGQNTKELRSLKHARDIDSNVEKFTENFKNMFLRGAPLKSEVDTRFILKHISDIYKSKGSIRGIELLIKLLYNEETSVYLPSSDILKTSDSKWVKPFYLELAESKKVKTFPGTLLTGSISNATGFCESVITKTIDNRKINIAYITDLKGDFQANELITNDNSFNDAPLMLGSLNDVKIRRGGRNNNIGDILNIKTDKGVGGKVKVTDTVNNNGTIEFEVENGGFGYTVDSDVYVSSSTIIVDNVRNSNNEIQKFYDFEDIQQPIQTLSVPAAELTDEIIENLFDESYIGTIKVLSPGSGYSNTDIISFSTGNARASITTDNLGEIDTITIVNTGSNYNTIPDYNILTANGTGAELEVIMGTGRFIEQTDSANDLIASGYVLSANNETSTDNFKVILTYGDSFIVSVDGTLDRLKTPYITPSLNFTVTSFSNTYTEGQLISYDPNNNRVGIVSNNNIFYDTTGTFIKGTTSNTYADVVSVGKYENIAGFEIGSIDDVNMITYNTDLLSGNNASNIPIEHIKLDGQINTTAYPNANGYGRVIDFENDARLYKIDNSDVRLIPITHEDHYDTVNSIDIGTELFIARLCVESVYIQNPGSGYVIGDIISQTDSNGDDTGIDAVVSEIDENGGILSFNITRTEHNKIFNLPLIITASDGSATTGTGFQGYPLYCEVDYSELEWMGRFNGFITNADTGFVELAVKDVISPYYPNHLINAQTRNIFHFDYPANAALVDKDLKFIIDFDWVVRFTGSGYESTAEILLTGGDPTTTAEVDIINVSGGLRAGVGSNLITVSNEGAGYKTPPNIDIINSITGSGARFHVVMDFGYGIGTNTSNSLRTPLKDIMDMRIEDVGVLKSLRNTDSGGGYNLTPSIRPYNKYIASYGIKDQIITVNNIVNGFFQIGDNIEQTINKPTVNIPVEQTVYDSLEIGEGLDQRSAITNVMFFNDQQIVNTYGIIKSKQNNIINVGDIIVNRVNGIGIGFTNLETDTGNLAGSLTIDSQTEDRVVTIASILSASSGQIFRPNAAVTNGDDEQQIIRGKIINIEDNDDNTKDITVRLKSFDRFQTSNISNGNVTGNIIYERDDPCSKALGDNAIITGDIQSSNGVATQVEVISSGIGYIDNDEVNIGDDNLFTGVINVNKQGIDEGRWLTNDSFLNDNSKIHDNDYYQSYSYVIKTGITLDKYSDILKHLLHVSGFKLFGDIDKIIDHGELNININNEKLIQDNYESWMN